MITDGEKMPQNIPATTIAPRVTLRFPRVQSKWLLKLLDRALTPLLLGKAKKVASLSSKHLGGRVLDIGSGRCYIAKELADRNLRVTCLDIKNLSRNDMKVVVYDGATIPFPKDEYDSALIAYVLHHCDDPVHVLSESVRVCKGNLVIFEDTKPSLITDSMDQLANQITGVDTPCNFRSEEEWRRIFAQLNLKIVAVEHGVEREWFYPFVEHTMFVVRK